MVARFRALTRNGNDWTRAYRRVVDAAASWPAKLHGSMAKWPSKTTTASPDFHALRSAIYTAPHRILFCAFDLLQFNGQDLRGHPLMGR